MDPDSDLRQAAPQNRAMNADKEAEIGRIVERIEAGDQAALADLFAVYRPKICSFLSRRCFGRREDGEDLTQEVFLKIYLKFDSFVPGRGTFIPWMWRIAIHTHTDYLRRRPREPQGLEGIPVAAADGQTHEQILVHQALAQLDDAERLIVELSMEGLTAEEIATVLGTSPPTARRLYYKALENLRAILGVQVAKRPYHKKEGSA
jgi:RNA polymerase sigma-70 factor (ECF subfamily)